MKLQQKKIVWIVADVCRRIGMAWRVRHGQLQAQAKRGAL